MFLSLDTRYRGTRNGRTGATVVTVSRRSIERVLLPYGFPGYANGEIFDWGYEGNAARVLAHSLLRDFTQSPELAQRHLAQFVRDYVAEWQESSWQISGAEIVAWLQTTGAVIDPELIPDATQRS
jgi:hypothetical protein